ncbi:MAG: hypothetical protein DMF86_10300 [Acidobacteria bacterium]|nr:MAG: hypothetical protein DMF86_10300 [Acidobacteriota bacterium]
MSFLDRFKLQPKWKSADPEVRAAGVLELGESPEDYVVLASLACEDADTRVRRAAVNRVQDLTVLTAVASSDADDALRAEVADRLASIAATDTRPDVASAALAGVADQKHLASIAKSSAVESVRADAVGRVTDLKALSSIARQAGDARTALLAAERITEPAELLNVAAKTDHKDAGVSALERAVELRGMDRETLDGLASRAKNKSVAKRAKAMMQALDEAEAARQAALEQGRQRLAAAVARVEALTANASRGDAAEELAAAEGEWRELAHEASFGLTPDDEARFRTAVAAAREAMDEVDRERARQRELAERLAAVRDRKLSLCERIDALRGETMLDDLAQARGEWEGLPPVEQDRTTDPDRELLTRFEDACRRATERHANRQELERLNARLDELSREAEQVSSQDDSPAYVWESIAREWRELQPKTEPDALDAAIGQRFTDAEARIRQRVEARRLAAEKALRQQLQRLEQLIERAHKRAAAEDLTLREADKAARDLRAAIETPPLVPQTDRDSVIERLKGALSTLAPRLHELREMDEWKRFANAALQEELIAKTEALRTKYDLEKPEDVEKAARELHDIQERWKQVAEAPRAQAQTLWHRYRQAADPIQAKAREFFAHRAEERQGNLEKKLALCERAEAVADSTDWIRTADELKKLQAEWQQIGPIPRAETRIVWKRFRDACDRFFTRRNADLAQRKEVWAANQARKEALCARAEELAESREWERAAAEIRRLQAEWKNVGPVRRNKSEALWQRFRGACDRFFERYKRRDEIELESRQADREALVQELEGLAPASARDESTASFGAASPESARDESTASFGEAAASELARPPADLVERVRSLRSRWNQTTPAVRQGADPLSGRFMDALERLITTYPDAFKGTELDIEANRQRMERLCARVEGFAAESGAAAPNSSQALAAMLREALAANTIGGRAGEESKWRAMADDVRQAQASWARLGPVPGESGRQLADRFHKACNRFFDQYRRRVPQAPQRGGSRPVTTTR